MQAISHGRRLARAASAAIRAEAAEGGEAAAFRRGILGQWHWRGARARGGKCRRSGRRPEIHAIQLGPASTAGPPQPPVPKAPAPAAERLAA